MEAVRFPEFIASLENTKYPFVPTATLTNGDAGFVEGTFLDAHLYSSELRGRCYLSEVEVTSDRCILFFGDDVSTKRLQAELTIPITNDILQLVDEYGRPAGVIVSEISRLSLLPGWGVGTHRFERTQTEFCVTCQMPVPMTGVTGLRLESGEILTGRVWLVGEDGVILRSEIVPRRNGGESVQLRIDVVGNPLFLQQLCTSGDLFAPVNPIRVIRIVQGHYSYDCEPDAQGNFNIQMNDALAADAALRIRTTEAGIVFSVEGSANAGGL